jgi:hypothetical protein
MILLIGLYCDPDPNRCREFLQCVERNAKNPLIDLIYIFLERSAGCGELCSSPYLNSAKVRFIPCEKRACYQDLFTFANQQLHGQRVILANSDIYFDHTLGRLDGYDLSCKLLCLSRWDVQPDGGSHFFDHPSSQDAWIFATPIRPFPCAFPFGVPGCDNRLVWEASRAGLTLLNPSRSIRAHHLHLTGMRRYTERQRLAGPTAPLPAGFLGTPWLWFVIAHAGNHDALRNTLTSLLSQPRSTCVVIDCDGSASGWLATNHPSVQLVECGARPWCDGAEARNRGAAAADDDAVLCFLDTGATAAPDLSVQLLAIFENTTFLVPACEGDAHTNVLVCAKAEFDRAGGFDQAFPNWGQEVCDLSESLCRVGLAARTFPASWLSSAAPIRHEATDAIHTAYRRAKRAALDGTGEGGAAGEELESLLDRFPIRRSSNDYIPPADIAFREGMGYTIARLEPGASSHNNDLRPFAAVASSLAGLSYTQVVSCSSSPVEVQFLSGGKLYVLVGTDWAGGRVATVWLRDAARRETMPPLRTLRGTGFEVWSLIGQTGDRLTLPTQVMLVARRLDKM